MYELHEEICKFCATSEGAELVLEFFEARFLKAHPEIITLAMSEGELDRDVVLNTAQHLADADDPIALDFIVAFGLWNTVETDLYDVYGKPSHV